jgi:hypothetical protein
LGVYIAENAIPWKMVGWAYAFFTLDFIACNPMQNESTPDRPSKPLTVFGLRIFTRITIEVQLFL